MEDRWLSVEQVADYLGVSKDTVYAWITTKGMPAHRVGRLWKFKKDAVDTWVHSDGAESAGASSEPEGAEAAPVPPARSAKKPGTKRGGGKR